MPTSKPSSARRSARDAPTASLGAVDITGYQAGLKFLHDRADIERMRTVRYDQRTFKLDRMRHLLERLGNPQDQVKMVHVAGTVGKGSTVAMIAHMLQSCGYAVGQYTSPHLVDVRERITIDGHLISKNDFTDLTKQVAAASRKLESEPTFFELTTAMAFKYFAEQAVDVAVVEVGLGGRLDSTNVITPEVSVICTIDYDHTRLLGTTLREIAREKAGILKKNVPALMFEQQPEVEAVVREIAEKVGAPLSIVNRDIEFSSRFCATPDLGPHTRVCLFTKTSRFEHLPVPLAGEHQAINCGLALAVVDILRSRGFDCPEDRTTAGLARTTVPGRMTLLSERPKVLVDGAHNPISVGALMRCVGAHVPYDSMVCIFGCCADKDIGMLLDRVNLGADKVIFTRASNTPRAADPDELQRLFAERSGKMSQVGRNFAHALELAHSAVSREDLIVVTGSFYLVGDAMRHFSERRERSEGHGSHGASHGSGHRSSHGSHESSRRGGDGSRGHGHEGSRRGSDTASPREHAKSASRVEPKPAMRGEPRPGSRVEPKSTSRIEPKPTARSAMKAAPNAKSTRATPVSARASSKPAPKVGSKRR